MYLICQEEVNKNPHGEAYIDLDLWQRQTQEHCKSSSFLLVATIIYVICTDNQEELNIYKYLMGKKNATSLWEQSWQDMVDELPKYIFTYIEQLLALFKNNEEQKRENSTLLYLVYNLLYHENADKQIQKIKLLSNFIAEHITLSCLFVDQEQCDNGVFSSNLQVRTTPCFVIDIVNKNIPRSANTIITTPLNFTVTTNMQQHLINVIKRIIHYYFCVILDSASNMNIIKNTVLKGV